MTDPAPATGKGNKVVIIILAAVGGCFALIILVGVLAALILPATARALVQAKKATTLGTIRQLESALKQYEMDHGGVPPSGIESLMKALATGRQGAPYLEVQGLPQENGKVVDAFLQPLVYRRGADGRYILLSVGPDGEDDNGEDDDITAAHY